MNKPLNFFLIYLAFIATTLACNDNEALVDYYEDFYNRRTVEALNYELPTDARMYEAENEYPQGKHLIILI